jgi:hypothetical protein
MSARILLVLAVLAGCGAAPKRADDLMDAVRGYNEGVRWERFPIAAARVPPREREEFVDERDQIADDLRISDYEVMRVKGDGERRASVDIKYTWYLDSAGVVHETRAIQRWERHGRAWLIVAERRLRGEPMPGLTEPEADKPSDAASAEDDAAPAPDDGDEHPAD